MIKVKLGYLVNGELTDLNPALRAFLGLKVKQAGLRYDIQTKLGKAALKELNEFNEQREKICQELATEKEITIDGETRKTKLQVQEVDGKTVEVQKYDIPEDKLNDLDSQLRDLLDHEIELNCNPIKLSKLELESDVSELNFYYLDPFIVDDRT